MPWNPKPDDTLRYNVLVTKAVPQETVRINVSVTVLARPDETTDAVLAERVRPALHNFIRGEWMVSGLERQGDAVGFERVSLRAATRVAFAENFNLTERVRLASLNGLSIVDPEVDRALAPDKVTAVVKDLWFEVIERVKQHVRVMCLPQPSAALDVGEEERDRASRQQAVSARGRRHGDGARMAQEPHSASRSSLTQLTTFPQGQDELADLFALRPA